MLEPLFPTEDELQALDDWVTAGGTLIAIGEFDGGLLSFGVCSPKADRLFMRGEQHFETCAKHRIAGALEVEPGSALGAWLA